MAKIAIIGLVGESVFLSVDRHQAVGETAHASSIHREWGGKGYNAAVAAARFGSEVSFLAAVSEADAAALTEASAADGIRLTLAQKNIPTAYGVIVTDKAGDNRVTVYGGAALDASDVALFEGEIASCDILLLSNEVPEAVNVEAVRIAKSRGKRVILNPAPSRDICEYLLSNCDIMTPNEYEAESVSGLGNLIITLGRQGSYIKWLDMRMPALCAGDVCDTTGAGDTFNGVLAASMAEGFDVIDAVKYATAASAIKVTRSFVIPAIPTRLEIEGLLSSLGD